MTNKIQYVAFHGNDKFVSLTDAEYREALALGSAIFRDSQERAQKGKMIDKRPGTKDGVTGEWVQQLGCISERAVAKFLNIPYRSSANTFKGADLEHNIEVRTIGVEHYGMRVKDGDDNSRIVIGVVIPKGRERKPYRLPGWIRARDAKNPDWIMDPNNIEAPFFGVPQEFLISLDYLPLIVLENLTADECMKEEQYRYQERLGIMCGDEEPTPEQKAIARREAADSLW